MLNMEKLQSCKNYFQEKKKYNKSIKNEKK